MNKKKHQLPKNPRDKIDPYISEKIKMNATKHSLNCKKAHEISTKLGVSPEIVGASTDMLGIKLNRCQLGLFGCNETDSFRAKLVDHIVLELKTHILKIENKGILSCKSAWWISKKLNLEKVRIAAACEILGIKISKCQLGAF